MPIVPKPDDILANFRPETLPTDVHKQILAPTPFADGIGPIVANCAANAEMSKEPQPEWMSRLCEYFLGGAADPHVNSLTACADEYGVQSNEISEFIQELANSVLHNDRSQRHQLEKELTEGLSDESLVQYTEFEALHKLLQSLT